MANQRRIRISREGLSYTLVVLAVLTGAVARELNLLMLLGSVLAGPLLFSLIYGRLALRRLVVERKFPPRLGAEQRLNVDISVTNRRRWLSIWAIEIEDHVEREGEPVPRTRSWTSASLFRALRGARAANSPTAGASNGGAISFRPAAGFDPIPAGARAS